MRAMHARRGRARPRRRSPRRARRRAGSSTAAGSSAACRSRRAGSRRRPCASGASAAASPHASHAAGLLRVVGDDHVGAGAADRGQRLERRGALVDPAVARRRPSASSTRRRPGRRRPAASMSSRIRADHVEVGQRRLTITMSAPSSTSSRASRSASRGVGGVHLVAAAVAELRRRLGGLAEGAVEGRGVLGRVGEDRRVGVALLVELEADRADPAVHHVAGRDRVGAGLGVRDRGLARAARR